MGRIEAKNTRMMDMDHFATNMHKLFRRIQMHMTRGIDESQPLSEQVNDIYDLDISCETIELISQDPSVKLLFKDLDIQEEDLLFLADILDPDQNGSVLAMELLHGIKRLQGCPRRSDIVTVDLM